LACASESQEDDRGAPEEAVAEVNGDRITVADFDRYANVFDHGAGRTVSDDDILLALVNQQLVLQSLEGAGFPLDHEIGRFDAQAIADKLGVDGDASDFAENLRRKAAFSVAQYWLLEGQWPPDLPTVADWFFGRGGLTPEEELRWVEWLREQREASEIELYPEELSSDDGR
jgi:hypothetical protein